MAGPGKLLLQALVTTVAALTIGPYIFMQLLIKCLRHPRAFFTGPAKSASRSFPRALADGPWVSSYILVDTGVKFHALSSEPLDGASGSGSARGGASGAKAGRTLPGPSQAPTTATASGSGAGGGAKEILLCLHGFPENSFSWRYLLNSPELKQRYIIVAVDMRGYGQTQGPVASWWPGRRELFGMRPLVADVHALCRALGGGRSISLVAHDWGGVIAWQFACEYPHMLNRLIILDAPPTGLYWRNITVTQLMRSLYILFFQLPLLPEWYLSACDYHAVAATIFGKAMGLRLNRAEAREEVVEVYKWSASRPGALTAMLAYYRNLLGVSADVQSRPLPPTLPVLVLWGSEDGALGTELLRGLDGWCPDPRSRVRVIEGASHWLQIDAPDEVIKEVQVFTDETSAAKTK